ncbi:MAG: SRPBCC domain-containing protein [Candidatus Bathyarchaeota archaeon]|nr:SRPBCC domain-containing protein [Candidatus Bathyarchaeota archaeon]MDH5495306.1 SRPBCC domain-containing protein [Candidatus Bathyarchaeota archaeon]
MDKVIYHSINLKCTFQKAFEMFTVNKNLEKWLTQVADVEPKTGGKYELFWNLEDKENDNTVGCKILALHPNKFLAFEWKGPKQFKHFMNEVRPLTNVVVFFIPCQGGTEIHLLHTGWRNSLEWEEARQWFDRTWMVALSKLQKYVG